MSTVPLTRAKQRSICDTIKLYHDVNPCTVSCTGKVLLVKKKKKSAELSIGLVK